jgi:signal transduction histidine kinase
VQDNGPGLTPEQQAVLFQPFTRVTETRIKGHGLGLSIVRRIAEKLDGSVGVESQLNGGSRFWFELPAVG